MTVRATDNELTREQAKEQLKAHQRNLESAKEREQGLSEETQQLNKEWARINTQLIDVANRVQTGESKLSEIEDRLGGLDAQRGFLVGSLQRQHATIGKLLAVLQRMGRNPPPVVATPKQDALGMVRGAISLSFVFPQLREKAEALSTRLSELDRVTSEIKSQSAQLRCHPNKQ